MIHSMLNKKQRGEEGKSASAPLHSSTPFDIEAIYEC